MNWLTNFIRPKIQSFVEQQKEVPDNLWQKCPSCEGMLFSRDLAESMHVCSHCGHHMKIGVKERLEVLFDDGVYKDVQLTKVPMDPLKFKDRKRYPDRMREARQKTGRDDGIVVARGAIGGSPAVVAVFDFSFMGGSMGTAVGEGVYRAAETALKDKAALIVVPASGGARMQEGMLSLMQMPRTIIAAEMVKEAGLPYIVLLTDPTTGGVSASFAMVGDIHLAEPGCMIGFAGKRVIEETIREELPEGFQTAEYLQEHGMVDMVVPRHELNETIGRLLDLMMNTRKSKSAGRSGAGSKDAKGKSAAAAAKSSGAKSKKTSRVIMSDADKAKEASKKPAANDGTAAQAKSKKSGNDPQAKLAAE